MSGLAQFWTVVFAVAVLLFLVVEVVVVVGGAGDIVAMVRSLVEYRRKNEVDHRAAKA